MTGRLAGKVAFITGAARGQGRSHAVALAREGADIIAMDLCKDVDTVAYPLAGPEDLTETVRQVEALDRRIIAGQADVRDLAAITTLLASAVGELGRLDVVCANAGVASYGPSVELTEQQWEDMIGINLSGVWRTIKACVPHIRAHGEGGSVIITSSASGLRGIPNDGQYSDDAEPGHDRPVPARTGRSVTGGVRPDCAETQPDAGTLDRARDGQQPRRLPGLRRGALHHRGRDSSRRRDVATLVGRAAAGRPVASRHHTHAEETS